MVADIIVSQETNPQLCYCTILICIYHFKIINYEKSITHKNTQNAKKKRKKTKKKRKKKNSLEDK